MFFAEKNKNAKKHKKGGKMNKVILMGRLARDPETRYTATTNTPVATFSLAVNRRYGEEKQADFINIVAWNKTAEFVAKFLKKGIQISVVGRLQTRNYDDKDGKRVYVTEVIAEEIYFADSKKESNGSEPTPFNNAQEFTEVTDDDLPF